MIFSIWPSCSLVNASITWLFCLVKSTRQPTKCTLHMSTTWLTQCHAHLGLDDENYTSIIIHSRSHLTWSVRPISPRNECSHDTGRCKFLFWNENPNPVQQQGWAHTGMTHAGTTFHAGYRATGGTGINQCSGMEVSLVSCTFYTP